MDKRKKAIEHLKSLIRTRRADIDPAVLRQARLAAEKTQGLRAAVPSGCVPYDREAAQKAVALFLKKHPGQKEFSRKLLELLDKNSH